MKISCQVMDDILPLYAEELASEDTRALVEEHLAECEICSQKLESMKTPKIEKAEENIALPMKKLKKTLKKRTVLTVCLSVFLVVALIWTGFVLRPASIDYGESELYSMRERKEAAMMVKAKVGSFEGCKLYNIRYEGDEASLKALKYHDRDGKYTEIIVFQTFFRSPIMGGGAWNANTMYSWSWYLGRKNNGNWELITWGYG